MAEKGGNESGQGSGFMPSPFGASTSTSSKNSNSPLKFTPTNNKNNDLPLVVDRASAIEPLNDMDPFEVRIRFTQFLGTLNASVTSAQKTAQYAIKYRDMDEDLHNCIIEQLERVSTSDLAT